MATLDKWLDHQGGYSHERKHFTLLLEKYGMKIPILAAQRRFEVGEIVYLAFPPYIFNRYADRRYTAEDTMGRFTVSSILDIMGMIEVNRSGMSFILPGFFVHRNPEIARNMYRHQVDLMIEVEMKEIQTRVSERARTYSVPGTLLTASTKQKDEMFIEAYDKASIRDAREKIQKLGF